MATTQDAKNTVDMTVNEDARLDGEAAGVEAMRTTEGETSVPDSAPTIESGGDEIEQKKQEFEDQAVPAAQEKATSVVQETLTVSYERLRHSIDSKELSEVARAELPDSSNQSAFSRATALLEAVAGNPHTPLEDRVFLAENMPFPNVLVKLSQDPDAEVRRAVAANVSDKNWLVGNLTKDEDAKVRAAALVNPQTSWKMRLEGAQSTGTDTATLDVLGKLGAETENDAPVVLSSMVRRAVALNPNTSSEMLEKLARDARPDVAKAAQRALATR
ncbi:MAG: AbrB family transcriptional regulator [Bifidobacterium crudilactis]|nr:AbrB family transcriptional regulator [Bifidobacterium crudilactis]